MAGEKFKVEFYKHYPNLDAYDSSVMALFFRSWDTQARKWPKDSFYGKENAAYNLHTHLPMLKHIGISRNSLTPTLLWGLALESAQMDGFVTPHTASIVKPIDKDVKRRYANKLREIGFNCTELYALADKVDPETPMDVVSRILNPSRESKSILNEFVNCADWKRPFVLSTALCHADREDADWLLSCAEPELVDVTKKLLTSSPLLKNSSLRQADCNLALHYITTCYPKEQAKWAQLLDTIPSDTDAMHAVYRTSELQQRNHITEETQVCMASQIKQVLDSPTVEDKTALLGVALNVNSLDLFKHLLGHGISPNGFIKNTHFPDLLLEHTLETGSEDWLDEAVAAGITFENGAWKEVVKHIVTYSEPPSYAKKVLKCVIQEPLELEVVTAFVQTLVRDKDEQALAILAPYIKKPKLSQSEQSPEVESEIQLD